MNKLKSPVALLVLDGWGLGTPGDPSDAIAKANPPHMKLLAELYPSAKIKCSGEAVGLPEGQMGNSEVGHLNIGAGRVVYQELTRISKSIKDGEFFNNPVLTDVLGKVKKNGSALHLMGLVSDGGVHSHLDHLYGLLELAKQSGVEQVYIHAFTDGRDVSPTSALTFINAVEKKIVEIGVGRIASVSGRYYAMDRDKRWDRLEKAYAALVYREGEHAANARSAVERAYTRDETDEFILPTLVDECGECGIKAGDGVIFFNFRPDRARQLTQALVNRDFTGFNRRHGFLELNFVCMTKYDESLDVPVAFKPQEIRNTLGGTFSSAGLTQLRIAETEKYAHVTYFFNGGDEHPLKGEERILVPSPQVATYDLEPEMSARPVADKLIEAIKSGKFDLVVVNFANGDMVGHTGHLDAAIKAINVVDECVGRVVAAMRERGGITLITADHGNAEKMIDPETGAPFTAHTVNNVPFILVSEEYRDSKLRDGILADIAPTVLKVAGLEQPKEMTGKSLII
ncbi:MAG: 2,3-bisphosphoglycerate-independent phosphoglycerate mutase [Firmicutes bacterium]|nr:2,3-bisphosphoglycerate-independent phosphoglycerate mutase [Bacillota bacterium]